MHWVMRAVTVVQCTMCAVRNVVLRWMGGATRTAEQQQQQQQQQQQSKQSFGARGEEARKGEVKREDQGFERGGVGSGRAAVNSGGSGSSSSGNSDENLSSRDVAGKGGSMLVVSKLSR